MTAKFTGALASYLQLIGNQLKHLLSYLRPPICGVCGRLLPNPADLCDSCHNLLHYNKNACSLCAIPLPSLEVSDPQAPQSDSADSSNASPSTSPSLSLLCGRCISQPTQLSWCLAPFLYDGAMKNIILAFKESAKVFLGILITDLGFQSQRQTLSTLVGQTAHENNDSGWVVVPIPSSVQKIASRGYNPALEIGTRFAKRMQLPIQTNLLKVADSKTQKGHTAESRKKKKAPLVCKVPPPKIILVDDVMTTGATLEATAKELKRHGAIKVAAFVLARAHK